MKKVFICALFVITLGACQTKPTEPLHPKWINYSYKPPLHLDDGWEAGVPGPQDILIEKLEEGVRAINRGEYPNIHSILIACRGKLIFEEYFSGDAHNGKWTDFDHNTRHTLQSATKSLTSLVLGIAYGQGFIRSIDSPVLDWYPEYDRPDRIEKMSITVGHLLTMRSGLEWDGWARSLGSPFHDLNRSYRSKDPINYVLRKKLVHEPGTKFNYNSGCTNLLGDIIYRSTGQHFDKYAEQYLFKPLGIKDIEWEPVHPAIICTAGGLKLRPRDLLKIGQLILQNGNWEGMQVVSEEWLQEALIPAVSVFEDIDYGFLWWRPAYFHPGTGKVLKPYVAAGTGGQYLIIYPEQNCIIVMTGGNFTTDDASADWHEDYFLPALIVKDN